MAAIMTLTRIQSAVVARPSGHREDTWTISHLGRKVLDAEDEDNHDSSVVLCITRSLHGLLYFAFVSLDLHNSLFELVILFIED